MYDLKEVKEVRFPVDGGSRCVYITVERILKFKETPGCKGCAGTSATRLRTSYQLLCQELRLLVYVLIRRGVLKLPKKPEER